MDTPNWALVANGSMARLLELDPAAATHWTERQCLTHPAARLHGSAAGHEPPGHSIAGRSGLAPRSEAVGAAERSRVAVFASNPFLGELMEQLDGVTHQRLVASHGQGLPRR
ncbi:host attachment protein [Diaphorobacter sp.]|uniref:host attachment protein n=1 Tax=Diaphorobacter sp. TaxID=1934310 RepID=UPI00258AAF5A|nr:host attachment protein [Diaphorobacter sp.]